MRSFTKKNPPYNNSLQTLCENPNGNANIKKLISNLATPDFKESIKNLINLTDNGLVSKLIEKDRDAIKQKFTALNTPYIQNFNTHFTTGNFPGVNVTHEITPLLTELIPDPQTIAQVLTATGAHNNLDISNAAPPFNVKSKTVTNIGTLLVLDRLIDTSSIRSEFIDAEYDIVNDTEENGHDYGDSKPYLVRLSGLYCAYCESTLTDGAVTDVEHKVPKGTFPTVERKWGNFVLACKRCNSGFKNDQYLHLEGNISSDPNKGKNKVAPLPYKFSANITSPGKNLPIIEQLLDDINDDIIAGGANDIFVARAGAGNTEKAKRVAAQTAARTAASNNVPNNLPKSLKTTTCINEYADIAIYSLLLKHSQENIIWPDLKYNNDGIIPGNHIISFQAFVYTLQKATGAALPTPIALQHIDPGTTIYVNEQYQIDIKGLKRGILAGGPNEPDVQLRINVADRLDQLPAIGNVANAALVTTAAENMITINGLNELHAKEFYKDQRIIRRTKAWLHAMKQIKNLTEFNTEKFQKLHKYYQEQLHPIYIKNKPLAPTRNNIATLRDSTPSPIVLDNITGTVQIPGNLPNGKITVPFTGTLAALANVTINGAPPAPGGIVVSTGNLTGEITETGMNRTITGRIEIGAGVTALAGKIIFLKDAPVSNPPVNPTIITIGNQGVISNDNKLNTPGSPAEILKEWDRNREDLLQAINQVTTILQDFMWENILDMIRMGGFYSTWIRTFNTQSTPLTPYGANLVRKLEMKAQDNPEDPYQFHGTDAGEIINSIS